MTVNNIQIWNSMKTSRKASHEFVERTMIERSFDNNINFAEIYKNGDSSVKYGVWIYDDVSIKKQSMRKYIRMRPDETIQQGNISPRIRRNMYRTQF